MNISRRPASASRGGSGRPSKTSSGQDLLSYEDIIIAQYLEELRKPPAYTRNRYNYNLFYLMYDCVTGIYTTDGSTKEMHSNVN